MAQTIFMSSSVSDQKSISSSSSSSSSCNNQQLKKQPSGTRNNFMCRPIHDQNKAPTNIIHGGLLRPPQTYASLPIPLNYGSYQDRQPPLLPLPPPKSIHASLPTRAVQKLSSSSYSPTSNRSKINRNRDHQSLTPKKLKSKRPEKNEERKKSKEIDSKPTKGLVIESVWPSGPDPTDLPRDVRKVFLAPPSMVVKVNDFSGYLNDLYGSVFALAPPPSSLPLPKFSLRPKGSCNAQAAKNDAGATNDLRRLLRLH